MSLHWLAVSDLASQSNRQPPIGPPRQHLEARLRCELRLHVPQTGKVHGQDAVSREGHKLRKW